MGNIVAVMLGMAVALFGIMPLISFVRHTIKAHPRFVPLDLTRLPGVQAEQIQDVVDDLQKEGFLPETYLRLLDDSKRAIVYFILFANRVERSIALATLTVAPPNANKLPTTGDVDVVYQTRFMDGTVVETHNSRRLSYTPTLPNEIRNFLPSVQDLHRLHQLHCFAIEEHSLHIREGKAIYPEGQAAEYLSKMMEECCAAQVKHGYLREDMMGLDHVFRPTLKGAYLMTWSNMFPVSVGRWLVRSIREREVLSGFLRSPWGVALTR